MNNAVMDYLRRDVVAAVRLTQDDKNRIKEKAEERGMTLSSYMKETAMAGLERRSNKEKARLVELVKRQEMLNELFYMLQREEIPDDMRKKVEQLIESEAGLWQCL